MSWLLLKLSLSLALSCPALLSCSSVDQPHVQGYSGCQAELRTRVASDFSKLLLIEAHPNEAADLRAVGQKMKASRRSSQ